MPLTKLAPVDPQSALRWVGVAALLVALTTPSARLVAQEPHELTGSRFRISAVAGSVEVRPGQGPELRVELTRHGKDASGLRVDTATRDGVTSLEVLHPDVKRVVYPPVGDGISGVPVDDRGALGGSEQVVVSGDGEGLEAWAALVLFVPPGSDVEIDLGVGNVSLEGVAPERLQVSIQSGSVDAADITGELEARTGAGRLSLERFQGTGLSLTTGAGTIAVSHLTGDRLTLHSGAGEIRATALAAPEIDITVGAGRVLAGLEGPIEDLVVSAATGPVTLMVPEDFDASVRVIRKGDRRTDFAETETGFFGTGSGTVIVRTGTAEVHIRREPHRSSGE